MKNGFQRIIQKISPKAKVLDVGAWGQEGENTTKSLLERFGNSVICMNIESIKGVDIVADFYKYKFKKKFDLIVLDLGIGCHTERDWTDKGMARVHSLLKKNGILIVFIQTESEYQDTNISKLYNLFAIFPEGRRKDIIWVALQKK